MSGSIYKAGHYIWLTFPSIRVLKQGYHWAFWELKKLHEFAQKFEELNRGLCYVNYDEIPIGVVISQISPHFWCQSVLWIGRVA